MARAGDDVKAAVAAGYRQVAPGWHRWRSAFGIAGAPITAAVLETARPRPGIAALDVGCGAGEQALALAPLVHPSGLVVGIDLVAEMLPPGPAAGGPKFLVADAEDLPFPAATFDLVTSRLAIMHFPDPRRATLEMHRVLRPGGRCVVAAVGPPQVTTALVQVLVSHGARAPRLPDLPDPHRFGRPGLLASLFTDAGFGDVRERSLTSWSQWPGSAEDFWRAVPDHGFLVADLIGSLTERARRRADDEALDLLRGYEIDGTVRLPVAAVLVDGNRTADARGMTHR